jgi:hypothetical protein
LWPESKTPHTENALVKSEVQVGVQKIWEAERRNMHRLPVTASAEVIDLASGMRCSTRTTDVGMGGCFLDVLLPLPAGARVCVTLHHGLVHFQTEGLVVYSQPTIGMGIAFDELNSEQRHSLTQLSSV